MAKHHAKHHAHGGKAHHGKHHKKHGGREMGHSEQEHPMVAAGNPNVIKEAEEHKHGGKVHHGKHHRRGGHVKKHRAAGGPVTKNVGTFMTGGGVRPRLDRPGRKSGGRVGSDTSPLTSAHHSRAAESHPKTQEGGMSD